MKLIRIGALALFALVIVFSGCKKQGPTTFSLQVKGVYGNQSFGLNTPNIDAQGRYVKLVTLSFYLSHINLIKSNDSLVNLASVALFNFGDTMLTLSVPNIEGDFKGISFACGLDSFTNDTTNPNNYIPPNPLAGAYDMSWPMIRYQFEVLEGYWDTANIPIYSHALVYHIGTNPAYRPAIQLSQAFSVSGSPYTMVMYLDVSQIFNNTVTGESINIGIPGDCSSMSSSLDNPVILPTFADNFSHSFSLTAP